MTQVNFSGNTISGAEWAGDFFDREHLIPGGAQLDPTQFLAQDGVQAVLSAPAAVGATSLAVAALANPIPAGTVLNFGSDAAVTVTTSALAVPGATSISVTALSGPIPAGTILDFGAIPGFTVTLNAAVLLAATSLTVLALPGPVPAGTILDFGANAAGNEAIYKVTTAAAEGATSLTIAAASAACTDSNTATVPAQRALVEINTAAVTGATSLTVQPIPSGLASAATATFGGGDLLATVHTAASAAVTSIAVDAIELAIPTAASAIYPGAGRLGVSIPSGTPIGRTISERNAGTPYGPALYSDDEIFLTAFSIDNFPDSGTSPVDCDLYRHNSVVKENFLPNYNNIASNLLTALRGLYECTVGAN